MRPTRLGRQLNKHKEVKVQGPYFEVWRQRHEQLIQETEKARLVRELRAARRKTSSCLSGRPIRRALSNVGKFLVALRGPEGRTR